MPAFDFKLKNGGFVISNEEQTSNFGEGKEFWYEDSSSSSKEEGKYASQVMDYSTLEQA
jgi:hypothetical protein